MTTKVSLSSTSYYIILLTITIIVPESTEKIAIFLSENMRGSIPKPYPQYSESDSVIV